MERWWRGEDVAEERETSCSHVVVLPTPGVPVMMMLGLLRMIYSVRMGPEMSANRVAWTKKIGIPSPRIPDVDRCMFAHRNSGNLFFDPDEFAMT